MISHFLKHFGKQKLKIDKFKKENLVKTDLSKIISYLNNVFSCIDYNINCSSLSSEDIQFIFYLSLNLSPDLFIGKIFFPTDQFICHIKGKFHQIDQVPNQFVVLPSLIIEGRLCQIHRIFTFNEIWLNQFYFNPMNRLKQQICFQE